MLGAASSLLTLPRFHPDLPTAPLIDEGQDNVALFAASLVHAGILRGPHLDAHPCHLRKAIDTAVDQWLSPYHAQLQVFSTVGCGCTPWFEMEGDEELFPDIRQTKPAAFIVSNGGQQRESYYIGAYATALEKKHPGLGHALMKILHIAGTHGLGIYDPHTAYGEAQHHFWHGETDISEVADQFRDDEKDAELKKRGLPIRTDEEVLKQNGIPTPKDFFLEYPAWAVEFPGAPGWRPGKVPTFPTLPGTYRKAMAAANDLADHLRFVRRRWLEDSPKRGLRVPGGRRHPNDSNNLAPVHSGAASPILLRWSYEDMHIRLFDDTTNELMQMSDVNFDITAAACFDPHDAADCRDARHRFEAILTTGILADRLIRLTTTTDDDDPEV